MRNLKKILALVLALVMTFSVMATANAFSDDAQIDDTYNEAVEVLAGLKVFEGYEDGSFKPEGKITRAEVAAIIYRIVTGDVKDTQVGIYADYNKFDDVKSTAWYAGYVNYCANAEYIKGYGDGNFGPNDQVTGYQALAMILRALGYDKNGEFTGSAWQVQTASVGKKLGITENVTAGTLGTAATREVVAEILFQALLVPQADYTLAFGYTTFGNVSLGVETFKLNSDTGRDAWGRPSTLWYSGTTKIATIEDKAVYTNTVAVTGCDLLKALGYAETKTTVANFNVYTNGKARFDEVASCHNNPTACLAKQHIYGAQGRLMEVYATETANEYDVVYVDTFLAKIGATTKAPNTHTPTDSVALTVYVADATGTACAYTYTTGTAAYTKDAYALVTMADGAVKTVTEIAPAATAKGAYWLNTAAGETTIVGGVTYNDACKFFVGQDTWDATKNWNVYTDTYGNIIGLVEYIAPNTYAYGVISAIKWVDTNDLLNDGYVLSNIVKMDATTMANTILKDNTLTAAEKFTSGGTASSYAYDVVAETTQNNNGQYDNWLFEYTLNADGSYNITGKANAVAEKQSIKAGVANLFVANNKAMATNDNTVYLVKTGTAAAPVYTSYVGYKNVPSMNNVTVQFMEANAAKGIYSDYVYVDATAATYDGQAGYVWFTKDMEATDAIGFNATGDKAYLAYIDGVLTPVYVDAASEAAVMTAINGWDLYKVTRNADGDITSAERWTNTAIANVTGITGTVITNGTVEGTLNVTGATVYAYAANGSSVSVVAEADWASVVVNTTNPKTAYVKDLDADGIVDIIYVVAD